MSGLSDENYLRAWAERADETAFRALVGRYAGFIYGAALRRVGDAGLAEEITQDVFARLSQNAARLVGHPAISGWLHRAAMLLALDRLRRRRRAEHRIAQLSQMNTPTAADPLAEALPHLDEALDQLASRDREVLVLHFFDRLTFPEIATRLGGTADAARMRTNRALSALSATLRKKGVTLSATALATGLGGTFAQAAPATLAVVSAALAGAGKVSALSVIIHALQTMKTAKAAAIALLALVLATPLIFQQQQIAAAEARLALLEDQRATLTAAKQRDSTTTPDSLLTVGKSGGIDLARLAADAIDGGYPASRRIRQAVERLDNNNLVGLIETVLQTKMMPEPREMLIATLLAELRKRDTPIFLEWSKKSLEVLVPAISPRSDYAVRLSRNAVSAFRDFVATQPAKAAEWAAANGDEWKPLTKNAYVGDTSFETLMVAGFLRTDQKRAFAMMSAMPVEKWVDAFWQSASDLSTTQTLEIARWASTLPEAEKRRRLVRETIISKSMEAEIGGSPLDSRGRILISLGLDADDLAWLAPRLAVDSIVEIINDAEKVPKAEFDWLASVVPAVKAVYARGVAAHMYQPTQALIFLNRELDQTASDELIAGYVESEDLRWHTWGGGMKGLSPEGGRHGDTAFRIATRTSDPERRVELLTRAWTDLHNDSAKAAAEILSIPELSSEDRAALKVKIAPILKKKP